MSKDLGPVETPDEKGFRESSFGDETVVDSPRFEEAGCVGRELQSCLYVGSAKKLVR